jgi:uncharacterized protein (UPF0261 family)
MSDSSVMPKKIVIIGTLDTKGQEVQFVKNLIEGKGHLPLTIDCGIRGTPYFQPTFSREVVAEAAQTKLDEILTRADKNEAIEKMAIGTTEIVLRLYREGRLDGIIALGGVQGTVISTTAMQALPLGVPKVMISTVANGQTPFGPFTGTKDITILHSVADIAGLNFITRQVLAEGVGAITGMVEMELGRPGAVSPAVAMTTAGVTTLCATRIRELMESWGYEVIAFHCNGIGAKAMEELAGAGELVGILDLTPHDVVDFLFGGIFPASPTRMEGSCRRGIPQVVIPGAADFTLYGPLESVPPKMQKRRYVEHNPIHTHIKTTHEEMVAVGRYIAKRLALSAGPAEVLIPERGFSQLNVAGGPLFEPESDRGFLEGLTQELGRTGAKHVRVRVVEMHINDPAFAQEAARSLHALILENRRISGDIPKDG